MESYIQCYTSQVIFLYLVNLNLSWIIGWTFVFTKVDASAGLSNDGLPIRLIV